MSAMIRKIPDWQLPGLRRTKDTENENENDGNGENDKGDTPAEKASASRCLKQRPWIHVECRDYVGFVPK